MTSFGDGEARLLMAVRTEGDRTTLTLTGELDLFTGGPLTQLLDRAMDGSVRHVDVHMAGVDFVDVAGMRALMRAYRVGVGRGVTLTLHDPQPEIVWLLRFTGAAVLLAERAAPAETTRHCPGHPPLDTSRVPPAGTPTERDRWADEREEQADDRDRLAQERDRLTEERAHRVREHQRWADIREDLADARERDLQRREDGY